MNVSNSLDPAFEPVLSELAGLGMRAARVVVRLMEIEQAAADVIAQWLPEPKPAMSVEESLAACQSVDAVEAQLKVAVPRVEVMARALDRVSRSVRRSAALLRRMQAGWPRAGLADDRQAMTRRQVAHGVAEVITRTSEGEAAERLFDDLAERLDDPGLEGEMTALPVEEVVRRVCRDLGLVGATLRGIFPGSGDDGAAAVPGPGRGGSAERRRPAADTC